MLSLRADSARVRFIMKQRGLRVLFVCVAVCLLSFTFVTYIHNVYAAVPCPCHVFPVGATPAGPGVNDSTQISFGTRFSPAVDGYVTGVRFYKDVTMTDAHTGSLWNNFGGLLASGTYTGETASGWQDLTFTTPVHVTAGTSYVASMYSPTGKYLASSHYFDVGINNYPLNAPVGAGLFHYGSDAFPDGSFNNGNYWVDTTFRQTINSAAPTVTAVSPLANATGAYTGANVIATLDQNVDTSTVNSTTIKLTDHLGADIPATITYNDSAKTITIDPTAQLSENATYTASIHGGAGGVTNLDGTALASDYQWAFTTGTNQCPCNVWNKTAPSDSPVTFIGTNGGEEFGQSMHADENGYIKAVRFYKPLKSTNTSHTVHVWTQSGTLLATATSSNESNYGWQEVPLPSGVPVTQGQNYVVSYFAPDNAYVYSLGVLSAQAGSGPIHINASGSRYEPTSDVFPTRNDGANATASFWIDAVFTTADTYVAPFTLDVAQPVNGAYGVLTTNPLTFKFSNAVDGATAAGALSVKTAGGTTVAGSVAYDDPTHTIRFTPSTPLAASTSYTATFTVALHDIYGTSLAPTAVSFSTGGAFSTDINQGMGGPVLILTSAAYPYDTYLAEMLRAQGINYFDVKDISQISSGTLGNYAMVLLGKSSLSNSQVTTLTSWVQSGGNLIAMQPDKKLASLLGLTDQNSAITEGYLRVDATQNPGKGITSETMQYHYGADVYTVGSGTQTVATLYSNATTPTTNPAVTQKSVGSGHAAAFMYDLPKSIALTHQGNPAWAGQERDANGPIRPNDLFNGNGGTDWLNLSKAHIPQADEQQRLLTNVMTTISTETPLPSFWMLPHGYKTAIIMIEDDHASASSTFDIFDEMINASSTNCSVADWGCRRSGSLLYTTSGLTPTQANTANALGFSMGDHVENGCGNYSSFANLNSFYNSQMPVFQAKYSGLPAQRVDRTHCYLWSDWDSVPKVDIAHGMHMNFNYEWYPNTWTGSNKGYLTGSGMTMRFTDASGALLDDYQGVTDLDYETDPTNATVNALLDNALNSNEFYGVFGTHYDTSDAYHQLLMTAAQTHNIPLISAEQMLTWKNALGSSNFTNISSTKYKLDFTTQVGQGGQGTQAMIPTSTSNGALTSLKVGSVDVVHTTSTIKGIEYAIFNAIPGSYEALYGTQPANTVTGPGNTSTSPSAQNLAIVTSSPYASISNPSPFSTQPTTDKSNPAPKPIAPVAASPESNKASLNWWPVIITGLILMVIILIFGYRRHKKQTNV